MAQSDKDTLGSIVRALRKERGWTLRKMSEHVGLPLSTLAKVEVDKLSLTYDKLQHIASRLGLTLPEFLSQGGGASARQAPRIVSGRRSLAIPANSIQINTPNYDYEYLCTDLREKRMVPILTRIRAHSRSEFGDLLRHEGEEFIYVLEGAVEFHSEFYATLSLKKGEGIYLDSAMGHAYIATGCESALVLAVCSGENMNLVDELMVLAAANGDQGS